MEIFLSVRPFCEGKKQVDLKIHFMVPKAQISNKKNIFEVTEPNPLLYTF